MSDLSLLSAQKRTLRVTGRDDQLFLGVIRNAVFDH
jgi:hypothetical protein